MRLIDADALMDVILHSQKINRECELEEDAIDTYDNGQQETFDLIINIIDNQPTAYDVYKVVEELEENASRYTKKYATPYGNNGYRDTKAISIHKAIEIVKRGGVDAKTDS